MNDESPTTPPQPHSPDSVAPTGEFLLLPELATSGAHAIPPSGKSSAQDNADVVNRNTKHAEVHDADGHNAQGIKTPQSIGNADVSITSTIPVQSRSTVEEKANVSDQSRTEGTSRTTPEGVERSPAECDPGWGRAHSSWKNARQRCNNPNHGDYANYGGRGIEFASEWSRFDDFYADMGSCPKGHTLDRIDREADYEPGNCCWATPKEQARNRRSNRRIEFNGEIRTVAEWAERTGIPAGTICKRIDRSGWSYERALTTDVRVRNRRIDSDDPTQSHADGDRASGAPSPRTHVHLQPTPSNSPEPSNSRPESPCSAVQPHTIDSLNVRVSRSRTVPRLEDLWRAAHAKHYPEEHLPPWSGKTLKQMREQFLDVVPSGKGGEIFLSVIEEWLEFTNFAVEKYGAFNPPMLPSTDWLIRNDNVRAAINFYLRKEKEKAKKLERERPERERLARAEAYALRMERIRSVERSEIEHEDWRTEWEKICEDANSRNQPLSAWELECLELEDEARSARYEGSPVYSAETQRLLNVFVKQHPEIHTNLQKRQAAHRRQLAKFINS